MSSNESQGSPRAAALAAAFASTYQEARAKFIAAAEARWAEADAALPELALVRLKKARLRETGDGLTSR